MGSAVSDKKTNEIKTLEEFENEWKEKRPSVIYHYTSIDSCWNILRTSTFRASHIMFQNDSILATRVRILYYVTNCYRVDTKIVIFYIAVYMHIRKEKIP